MGVYGRRCMAKTNCGGDMRPKVSCAGLYDSRKDDPDCDAHPQYSDSQLYNQLLYLVSLFDIDKVIESSQGTTKAGEQDVTQ